ncbi:senescence-specific cysteine protease SAG39 [Setaria viridis]|nr:senescence-specific cysteine protease SAG39-like [Setaria viridis]
MDSDQQYTLSSLQLPASIILAHTHHLHTAATAMAPYIANKKPLVTMALILLAVLTIANCICCTVAARDLPGSGSVAEAAMMVRFERWVTEHGRTYKDAAEKARRFQVFMANAIFVDSSNAAGGKKYHLAINGFADMTHDEFMARYTGYKATPATGMKMPGFQYGNVTQSEPQQAEVDWRQKGAVTGVKNQEDCGCCWAFSAVAAIEGIHHIKTGELVSLSEQQLLDCSTNGNYGCDGGNMDNAFEYIISNGGITTEDAYQYTAIQDMCQSVQPAVTIRSYQDVPRYDEDALAAAVANQPVSVGVDANNFQFYDGGVMTTDSCGTDLNHAVTIVGYGTAEDGSQYWLIKNSWGETWGEGGYLRLERGVNACGVAIQASYPVA